MSLCLPARRALGPAWLLDPLWARARMVPSLDLRFADTQSLRDWVSGQNLVTFTRASNGTRVTSTGGIETLGNDVPRFTFDPVTRRCLGLLVEEARTNSIRNNMMVGAAAGMPGTLPTNWTQLGGTGLTREVAPVGTENGIIYIDIRFSGTTGNTFTGIQVDGGISGILTATSYTGSVYLKRAAGALTNLSNPTVTIRYNLTPSGQTDISSTVTSLLAPSAALVNGRSTVTGTTTGTVSGVASMFVLFNHSSGVAVDITLRIGLPQLEQGAFATSVIPTTGTAATRAADIAAILSGLDLNTIRGMYAEFTNPASGVRGITSLNDNTANERIGLNTSGTDPLLTVVDGGVTQANIDAGTFAANSITRLAARFGPNDFAVSVNGGAEVVDTSGTMPTVDRLMIGRTQVGEYLNGPLARLVLWSQAPRTLQGVSA